MKLTKTSMASGKVHTMELPLSEEEFDICDTRWKMGMLIHDAFPMLNATQREFLMTGTTQEEWDAMIQEGEELI